MFIFNVTDLRILFFLLFLEVVAEIAEFGERWRNDGGVSEAEIIKAKK